MAQGSQITGGAGSLWEYFSRRGIVSDRDAGRLTLQWSDHPATIDAPTTGDDEMKISTRDVGNVTVLGLKGKFTIGSGDVALREAIDGAVSSGKKSLLVDLGGVSKMDSSGLGELVAAHNTVAEKNGTIKLANIPSKLYNIMGVAQIISVFDVFDDVEEGLGSFNQ
jgi:anti-sigma B factor antagonist